MANSQAEHVLRHLHDLLESGGASPDDGRLLQRFVAQRDEDAFGELVTRHGPLVFGLCRRLLRDAHDAEDVFQATFLVLARKAAAIRKPESLSCWLHGVAYRLALKAKTEASKRRQHERRIPLPREAEETDLSWRDVRGLIDEELERLPPTLRLPLVLCYLEGQTQDEAARRLGWSRGTLKRRLERGRDKLRLRLTRRGVTLGAGLFAVALSESAAKGAVPTALRTATAWAGMQFTTNEAGVIATTRATLLAQGALQTMLTTKLKFGALLILVLACAAAATGLASQQIPAAKQPENKAEAPTPPLPKASDTPPAEEKQVRKDRQGDPLPEGAVARLGTLRLRHKDMTASAVFTRDGKTAIVGDGAGNIVYWDVTTGQEVRRLQATPGVIHALAITADGKTLASGSWGRVFLWDVATGKLLSQAEIHNDAIMQMLFTPDGKTLALRSQGDTIHLWDAIHKKKLHELKGHTGKVACMALSPDGKTLASGSWGDPHIRLWDVASGKEKLHFAAHDRDVLSLTFSPDGPTLASIGNPGFAFFEANTGKKFRKVQDYYGGVRDIEYTPDGKTLIGIESGRVHVLDAVSGKHLRKFDAPPRTMAGLTISPNGKTVATFWGGANTFDLWDVASGKLLHPSPGHRHGITSLAFAAGGQTVFSAAGISDYELCSWDARTGEYRGQLGDNPNGVNGLALSPDGKTLAACGYNDNTIRLWDVATRKEIRSFKGHTSVIVSVAWSADGKTLVSGSYYDKSIRIWDAASGKERRAITYKPDWPCDVALSPGGETIAAGGYQNGMIRLWATATGKELRTIATPQGTVTALTFSPDGTALASGGLQAGVHLWDTATGRVLRCWDTPQGHIGHLAFSRDGRTLVSGHSDHSVRLWEVVTGKERACFVGHRGPIRAVAIARDSRRVASGSEDTTILVWDATGGQPKAAPSPDHLQALWADLTGTDAGRAYRALWQMAQAPKQALPFLTERLRPVAPLDATRQKQVEKLLADLDNEQFTVRQKAEHELETMGPIVEPALRKALEGKPALEARRRIDKVLEAVAGWSGERLRALRALEVIEHMNTPEARELLDALAEGEPRAWLTEEARRCRRRLVR